MLYIIMRLRVIIVFVLLTIIPEESKGQFVYKFPSSIDEELCDTIEMKRLGDWRRMSVTPMSRDSADACCKKRGMTLISDEVGVQDDLVGKYIIELYNAYNDKFWTSATDRKTPGKFIWENELELGQSPVYKFENLTINGHCVLMKIESETIIQLKTSNCAEEHLFICALQPIRTGKPLTEEDMESCADITYLELVGLPNLHWGHKTVQFSLARYCCEQKGWSIVDASITDNLIQLETAYQDPTFQKKSGLKFKYYVPHSIWLGYNDICQEMKFEWNCGERITYKPDQLWIEESPNNEDGNEHCTELGLRIDSKRLQINDIDCDFSGVYFMCMENPKCPTEKQFHCEKPRNVYINDSLVEEKSECPGLTFKFIGETEHFKYFLSDQSLSWSGAKYCLSMRDYDIASFEHPDEIEFLSHGFLKSSKRDISSFPLPQVWNTATNWLNPPTSDIKWQGVRPIKKQHRIAFRTHDDMYPMCGKTNVRHGVVGVFSEDCLAKLRFIYKIPLNVVIEPPPPNLVTEPPPPNLVTEPPASNIVTEPPPSIVVTEPPPSNLVTEPPNKLTNITNVVPTIQIIGNSSIVLPPGLGRSDDDDSSTAPTIIDVSSYEYYEYPEDEDDDNVTTIGVGIHPANKYTLKCNDGDVLKNYQINCPDSSTSPDSCLQTKLFPGEALSKIKLQNRRMRVFSVKMAVEDQRSEAHEPRLSFKLLKKLTEIYWHLCPSIALSFLQNAYELFHDLHSKTSQGRSEYLTKAEYNWAAKILRKCDRNIAVLRFSTFHCGSSIIGVGNCSQFICTNPMYEFNLHNTDPIVDIMWFVYELVHSACFPQFSESSRMFHKFSAAIMDLWTRDIRLRWSHQIENSLFWKRILGPFYATNLINMQRCNTAIIKVAKLNIRLTKQQLPNRIRLHGDESD